MTIAPHASGSFSTVRSPGPPLIVGAVESSTTIEKLALSAQSAVEVTDGQTLTVALDHERRDFRQRGPASWNHWN